MTVRPVLMAIAATVATGAFAQSFFVPDSTRTDLAQGFGEGWAHTNHLILLGEPSWQGSYHGPRAGGAPSGYGPTQLRNAYKLPATGGSGAIALVVAYHYPTALNDFNVFSRAYGLPVETSTGATLAANKVFQVLYASGHEPATNASWAQEAALDTEWSHALAPSAKIYLVEAASSSGSDLFSAVSYASRLPNVHEVSMSWGGAEFEGEQNFDVVFTRPGVDFFAATGDTGGEVSYPASSKNVISVGGTTLTLSRSNAVASETGWAGSGGGLSKYEATPKYQSALKLSSRATPDIALDADPFTGVAVYDSTEANGFEGWMVFGGTSLATPTSAAIANLLGKKYNTQALQLSAIYAKLGVATAYRDITSGTAGSNHAGVGYDLVTGVGASLGTGSF